MLPGVSHTGLHGLLQHVHVHVHAQTCYSLLLLVSPHCLTWLWDCRCLCWLTQLRTGPLTASGLSSGDSTLCCCGCSWAGHRASEGLRLVCRPAVVAPAPAAAEIWLMTASACARTLLQAPALSSLPSSLASSQFQQHSDIAAPAGSPFIDIARFSATVRNPAAADGALTRASMSVLCPTGGGRHHAGPGIYLVCTRRILLQVRLLSRHWAPGVPHVPGLQPAAQVAGRISCPQRRRGESAQV